MHRQKLRDCLGVRLAAPAIESVLDGLGNLERLSALEVGALIARLTAP
jgi:hypothetical protein